MAQCAVFQLDLFDFRFYHLVTAGFAGVIFFAENCPPCEYASLEVRAAGSAARLVFSHLVLASLSGTTELLGLRFLRRVSCEDADSNLLEAFTVIWISHSL